MGKATMSHACSRDPDQPMHLYSQKIQSMDTQWLDEDPIFYHSDNKGMQIWVLAVHTFECFFHICRLSHGLWTCINIADCHMVFGPVSASVDCHMVCGPI